MDCHGLSWTVMDCHGLSWTVMDKGSLTRHIKNIHKGIKYKCDQCNKEFTNSGTRNLLVWFGMGGCQMTSEFMWGEISILFHLEKFHGGWVGDIELQALGPGLSEIWNRPWELRLLKPTWRWPGPKLDNIYGKLSKKGERGKLETIIFTINIEKVVNVCLKTKM